MNIGSIQVQRVAMLTILLAFITTSMLPDMAFAENENPEGQTEEELVEELNAEDEHGNKYFTSQESSEIFSQLESNIDVENEFSKTEDWLLAKGYERESNNTGTIFYSELSTSAGEVEDVYETKIPYGHVNSESIANIDNKYNKDNYKNKHIDCQYYAEIDTNNEVFSVDETQAYISNHGYTNKYENNDIYFSELNDIAASYQTEEQAVTTSNSEACGYATTAVCTYHCGVTWTLACAAGGIKTAVICAVGCSAICSGGSTFLCNQI